MADRGCCRPKRLRGSGTSAREARRLPGANADMGTPPGDGSRIREGFPYTTSFELSPALSRGTASLRPLQRLWYTHHRGVCPIAGPARALTHAAPRAVVLERRFEPCRTPWRPMRYAMRS